MIEKLKRVLFSICALFGFLLVLASAQGRDEAAEQQAQEIIANTVAAPAWRMARVSGTR